MKPSPSPAEDRVAERLSASLQPEERDWVVAVSGGADSVFLLYSTVLLARRLGARVGAVHLNHGWRGAESDWDEALVRGLARSLGVPLCVGSYDPGLPAGANRQAWARRCRRRLLEACAGGPAPILLGHQAWDQSESVLAALLKGKAPWGVRTLSEREGRWLRPMLGLSGAEVRDRCRELGLEWREDASNSGEQYERGCLRHRWLSPLRARAGDEVDLLLARIALNLAQAGSEHARNVEELLVKLDLKPNPLGWSLERAAFLPYHEALSPDLLRSLGRRLRLWSRDPARSNLERVARGLATGRSGSCLPLGGKAWLELGRERAWLLCRPPRPQLRLLRPGLTIQLPGSRIGWNEGDEGPAERWYPSRMESQGTVLLRSWLPGDRLRSGPQRRRSLVDWMGERGYVPAQKRLQWVLQVDGEIRWCPGLGSAWPPTDPGEQGSQPIWVRTCASPWTT